MSAKVFCGRFVGAATLLVWVAVLTCGQIGRRPANPTENDRTANGIIRGRILLPDGSYASANVKITLVNMRDVISTTYTDNQGQFELRGLNPGNYQLEIEADRNKFELKAEQVQVFRGAPTVVAFTLIEKQSAATKPGSAVSVSELDRSIPSAARKEFEKASKLANENKRDEAIAHLRKAIELYPQFLMAYNDLGTHLLALGKLEEAGDVFRKAVTLDAKAFNPALNLGIVLVHQHKFEEALTILKTATSLEPNAPAARLYLGLAAVGLNDLQAGEKELTSAYSLGGSRFAIAFYHLGQLHLGRGDRELAVTFFERYLREVPDAANGDQVRRTIALLR